MAFFSYIATAITLAVVCSISAYTVDAAFTACASAPANPGDRRPSKTQLKVSAFNTEFLFLGNEVHTLACPGADCPWTTANKAQSHVNQIATVIKALNSDILQLNEVEDCKVLKAVITRLRSLGDSTYKPYLVKGSDSSTGQNSALLTRVDPVVDLKRSDAKASIPVAGSSCPSSSSSDYPDKKGVAKHFYTTFKVSGFSKPITLVGAHLLAGPRNKARCFEREAQATVLAGLADKAVKEGHHAIITGDMNDWSSAVPDRNNHKPISAVLDILTGDNFVQVASKARQSDRYTQWYDADQDCKYELSEVSSLDHILVSKSLSSAVSNVTFHHELYTTSCSGYNSDHFPVSIVLAAVLERDRHQVD